MDVFHYTHRENWRKIRNPENPNSNLKSPCFALLEPVPTDWLSGPFSNYWQKLGWKIGDVLLEINIDNLTENTEVRDYGHIAGYARNANSLGLSRTPDEYNHKKWENALEASDASILPLSEYLARKDELNFALPEVVIREEIPLSNIKIAKVQPLIEGRLLPSKLGKRLDLWMLERDMPELKPWIEEYKANHGLEETSHYLRR